MRRSLLVGLLGCALAFGACSSQPANPPPGEPEHPVASTSASSTKPQSTAERRVPAGTAESPRVALGAHGAVSSQEANATDVGLAILKQGGNAVDAAVAVAFALAVTHPAAGNIGGGGFMVIRTGAGESNAVDYRETAPSDASRDMYLDKNKKPTKGSLDGPKAAGIPGTVAGLALAHEKYGKLSFADLVAPAVALARDGFVLDEVGANSLAKAVKEMRDLGYTDSAKLFEGKDGKPLAAGDKLVQPELAKTLETIQKDGPGAFYKGPLADKLATEVTKAGGIWKPADLANYHAQWRKPIVLQYRGYEITTMPPPSSGGVVLAELLTMADTVKVAEQPWRSGGEIHLFVEAARRAYADRNNLLGDPDFVKMPLETLLSATYAEGRASTIDPKKATPSSEVKPGIEPPAGGLPERRKLESEETTHFSVVDSEGNAVSNTYTLNMSFGARFVVPGTGVLLNDEMDDFAVAPGQPNGFGLVQGEINRIEPNKRMLSSMTPTIVAKDGELRLILGSPGGPTITTTVAQLLRASIDYGQPLDKAVPAFRAHHQWLPDEIITEKSIPDDVVATLEKLGHTVKKRERIGHANVIEVDPSTRGFRAVADTTRGGGKAAAY
ncbi:MAG: gamma-glutamyltransferase [Polyangiaceae bacterium]